MSNTPRTTVHEREPDGTAPAAPSGRLPALDGLRGIAALAVVLHHTLLLNPLWPANLPSGEPVTTTTGWLLDYTPLKLFTAGWEAVMLFFVLSGLVVTLPVLAKKNFDWVAYYPRRVARLGIPVAGSLVLAYIWVAIIPQVTNQPDGTWFTNSSTPNLTWQYFARAVDLFGGDGQINNPVWSLRWEMLFSLALPVFVILALALRRWWLLALLLAVGSTWVGLRTGADSFTYLPAFFIGALMATKLDHVNAFADRINARRSRHAIWAGVVLLGAFMLIASWLIGPEFSGSDELRVGLRALTPLAGALLVLAAIGWRWLAAVLASRPIRFIGTISFSLYLVHVPILIFSVYLFISLPLIVGQIVGVVISVIVAVGFWWALEARSHGWSRSIGIWASALYARSLDRSR